MKNIFLILFTLQTLVIAAQDKSDSFDSLKTRAQINIGIPGGFKEVSIPFLHKIPHHFAVAPADSSSQIRFWIRPLDTWVADYNKKSPKEKKNSMHPNDLCKSMMMIAVLDASNNKSQDYQVTQFPDLSKLTYNTDWDAAALVENGWPQIGFKYCLIWCLHKDDTADVYIYILTNKKEDLVDVLGKVSPLIKFQ